MPKTSTYALGSVVALLLLMGGTYHFGMTLRGTGGECGGSDLSDASIGGPFRLVDGSGNEVGDEDVLAAPALVYFGYTFCPDVCPFDVARNSAAVDILKTSGHSVTPVFITVDPGRDTPDVVAEYAAAFHPDMIGLTGSEEQVEAAAKAYRVYFNRHESDDQFYMVDHSTFTYLALPGDGVVDYFNRSDTAEQLAERTSCRINAAG